MHCVHHVTFATYSILLPVWMYCEHGIMGRRCHARASAKNISHSSLYVRCVFGNWSQLGLLNPGSWVLSLMDTSEGIYHKWIHNQWILKHKSCIVLFVQLHSGLHRCVFGGRKRHSQSFCQERTFVDMFRIHPCLPRVTHMSSCTPARMYKEGLHGSVSCLFSVVSVVILSFV